MSGKTYDQDLRPRLTTWSLGWSKILIEESSDRIVGAHIVGHGGEELINMFALAMAHGMAAGDLRNRVNAFPTFSAEVTSML